MSSVIFIAVLAVVGSFFTALLGFLVVPRSASKRFGFSRFHAYDPAPQYGRSPEIIRQAQISFPETELSREERLFRDVLVKAVGDTGIVFAKVPVTNVVTPVEGQGWQKLLGASNEISDVNFDFVVCAADGSATKLVIELDEAVQASSRQPKRDQLLNSMCASAGLPFLKVRAARGYAIGNLRERLAGALAASTAMSAET
jgi:hypothetical protein